jgi:hypothetical protein
MNSAAEGHEGEAVAHRRQIWGKATGIVALRFCPDLRQQMRQHGVDADHCSRWYGMAFKSRVAKRSSPKNGRRRVQPKRFLDRPLTKFASMKLA